MPGNELLAVVAEKKQVVARSSANTALEALPAADGISTSVFKPSGATRAPRDQTTDRTNPNLLRSSMQSPLCVAVCSRRRLCARYQKPTPAGRALLPSPGHCVWLGGKERTSYWPHLKGPCSPQPFQHLPGLTAVSGRALRGAGSPWRAPRLWRQTMAGRTRSSQ